MPADNEKQEQTEVTPAPIQNPWRIFAIEAFLFFLSQKVRQPIPALPPIAFFSIIGFLITRLI